MVQLVPSPTAPWLAAGLFAAGLLSPASAMLPSLPYGGSSGGLHKRQMGVYNHKWAEITPSRKLEWEPCYQDDGSGDLQCARLIVPMDYENCHSNQTVTLAVVKRPAKDMDNYMGPVFVNPGGPGGSGIDFVTMLGPQLQHRVGLNHDIIGWDPRGVGKSTPKQACWANDQRRAIWAERWAELDMLNEFDDPNWIRQVIEQYKYEHKACEDLLGKSGILQHLTTAAHAHDLDHLLTASGNEKLRFWGISWGSVLATYYATLFPHKVDRIISEGNVDVRRWAEGDLISELADAERHMEYFTTTCAADEDCAMHEPTAEGVRRRLEALLEDLKVRPRVLTYSLVYPFLLSPFSLFELLFLELPLLPYHMAELLLLFRHSLNQENDLAFRNAMFVLGQVAVQFASLERSQNETVWEDSDSEAAALGDGNNFPEFSDVTRWDAHNPDYEPKRVLMSEEITQCSDWPEPNLDIDDIRSKIDEGLRLSPTGGITAAWAVWCAGATRPKRRFEGPFGGNTSFPILFVNSWDIITPVESAVRNAEIFPGSSLVTLDSYGHGITMYSECVKDHVYAYFQNGTVPEFNSTCNDIPEIGYGGDYIWPEVPGTEDIWDDENEPTPGPEKRNWRPSDEGNIMGRLRDRNSRLW